MLLDKPLRARVTVPPEYPLYQHIAGRVFINKPGAPFSHVYDTAGDRRGYFGQDGRITYRINSLGLRGRDFTLRKA